MMMRLDWVSRQTIDRHCLRQRRPPKTGDHLGDDDAGGGGGEEGGQGCQGGGMVA